MAKATVRQDVPFRPVPACTPRSWPPQRLGPGRVFSRASFGFPWGISIGTPEASQYWAFGAYEVERTKEACPLRRIDQARQAAPA